MFYQVNQFMPAEFSPAKSDLINLFPNKLSPHFSAELYKNTAKLLKPFEMAVNSFVRITLPEQLHAKTITDSAFRFENQLLLENHYFISLMQWIHQNRPDTETINDGNSLLLSEAINDFLKAYLAEGKVAKYRQSTITEFQRRLTQTLTGNDRLVLLHVINHHAYQSFRTDESYNNSALFKRNFQFSRYQLIMHHVRSLAFCAIPAFQLLTAVEQEVADIKRTLAVFDKQFVADNSSLDAFFNQVVAYSMKQDTQHFLTPILKNRCEFLKAFLELDHCLQLDREAIDMNATCVVATPSQTKTITMADIPPFSVEIENKLSWSQRHPILASSLYWSFIGLAMLAILSGVVAAIVFSGGAAGAVLMPLITVAYSTLGLYGTIGAFIGASIGLSFASAGLFHAAKAGLTWITSEAPQQQEEPLLKRQALNSVEGSARPRFEVVPNVIQDKKAPEITEENDQTNCMCFRL